MATKAVKTKKGMKYAKDKFGHDILLKDGNLQVMMEWEKPYMEACVDGLKPSGDVLEVGFGMGYSATRIQKYRPKSHTIIECDPVVIKKAKEWAKKYPKVKIVEGYWQDHLGKLGVFDTIFFDDYTPLNAKETAILKANAKAVQQAEKSAKKVNTNLKAVFKQMRDIKFTDAQVLDFVKSLGKGSAQVSPERVIDFIQTLAEQGNITVKQEMLFLDAYEKKNKSKKKAEPKSKAKAKPDSLQSIDDRLLCFYTLCLDKHMRKGARMSSYVNYKEFKKKYETFEDLIGSRPDVSYRQKIISVEVPKNCEYYTGNKALVLTITKKK